MQKKKRNQLAQSQRVKIIIPKLTGNKICPPATSLCVQSRIKKLVLDNLQEDIDMVFERTQEVI